MSNPETPEQRHAGVIDTIDSSSLARRLYLDPNNPNELSSMFDWGLTSDRSVGDMAIRQRDMIIELKSTGQLVDAVRYGMVDVESPLVSLSRRINDGSDAQPVGRNFF